MCAFERGSLGAAVFFVLTKEERREGGGGGEEIADGEIRWEISECRTALINNQA